MQTTTLKKVEKEYKERIQKFFDQGKALNADVLVEISSNLFQNIKVEGISTDDDGDNDMLLYQYGTYNWGDEKGEHFSFNITRQLIHPNNDEPYQLSFTLFFDPAAFKDCDNYNCWSTDFKSIEEWIDNIRATRGHELAKNTTYTSYEMRFGQV